jgi:uncharacterized membrane protein YbhN (UPF0104 family)
MPRWILRAVVSGAVAVVLFRFVPVGAVVDALMRMSVGAWLLAVGLYVAGHSFSALKLRLLAGAESVGSALFVRAQYAGLAANLGLPGAAGGDLVRAGYLTAAVGPQRTVLATVADRIIDTLTLAVFVAAALPVTGAPPIVADAVRQGGGWLALGGLVLVGVGVAAAHRYFHRAISDRLARVWTELRSRWIDVAAAGAISLIVQTTFVLINVWLGWHVGVDLGIAPWFVAWPLAKLVGVMPISLGGVGVREAALVSLLAPYGAPPEAVLAAGILWHAVFAVGALSGLVVTQGLAVLSSGRR